MEWGLTPGPQGQGFNLQRPDFFCFFSFSLFISFSSFLFILSFFLYIYFTTYFIFNKKIVNTPYFQPYILFPFAFLLF